MVWLIFLTPGVMLAVGTALKRCPPGERGSHTGYNTPVSRSSAERWELAQRIAPGIFGRVGGLTLAVSCALAALFWLCALPALPVICVGAGQGFAGLLAAFWRTEKQLKETFPD